MSNSDTKTGNSDFKSKYYNIIADEDNMLVIDTLMKRIRAKAEADGMEVKYASMARACTAKGCPVNEQFIRSLFIRRDGYIKNKGFREGERLYPTSIEVVIALIKAYKLNLNDFFVL